MYKALLAFTWPHFKSFFLFFVYFITISNLCNEREHCFTHTKGLIFNNLSYLFNNDLGFCSKLRNRIILGAIKGTLHAHFCLRPYEFVLF